LKPSTNFLASLLLLGALALTLDACAPLDYLFLTRPGTETAADPDGKSRAEIVGGAAAPFTGPYGQAIMLALMGIQNAYLGGRKLKLRRDALEDKKMDLVAERVAKKVVNGGV